VLRKPDILICYEQVKRLHRAEIRQDQSVKDLNSDSLRFSGSRRTFRNCGPVLTTHPFFPLLPKRTG
jgi:hypothetical protein